MAAASPPLLLDNRWVCVPLSPHCLQTGVSLTSGFMHSDSQTLSCSNLHRIESDLDFECFTKRAREGQEGIWRCCNHCWKSLANILYPFYSSFCQESEAEQWENKGQDSLNPPVQFESISYWDNLMWVKYPSGWINSCVTQAKQSGVVLSFFETQIKVKSRGTLSKGLVDC